MTALVVVGGLNMDLHLFGLRPSHGQALQLADRYLAEPGGKGANVSRAAARLGAEVRLIGRVGDDDFGAHAIEAVAADGVDVSGVGITPGHPTGFVAIDLVEGRHRSLLFASGANDLLTWEDVEPGVADLGPGDVLIVQAEVPTPVLDRLTALAVERAIPLLVDPTPPEKVRPEHLAAAEVVTPDLDEAAGLVGRSNTSMLWPTIAARELVELGARRVVIKTGERGAILADGDGVREIPTLTVEVRDETGAGDVFLAALAVARSEGAGWEGAVRFANAASALSVSGTGLTLPDRAAVDRAVGRLDAPVTERPDGPQAVVPVT